jgi:ferredoxin
MAAGRRAARSVLRLVRGEDQRAPSNPVLRAVQELGIPMAPRGGERWAAADSSISARLEDVDPGLTEPEAFAEARRCRMCGPCEECRRCTPTCDFVHLVAWGRHAREAVRTTRATAPDGPTRADSPATTRGSAGHRAPGRDRVARPAEATVDAGKWITTAAVVDPKRCISCGLCAEACPWSIPRLRTGRRPAATIDPGLCRSCGLCAGACPAEAILQPGWTMALGEPPKLEDRA